jgi:crotonobetainyl-CoA:carnitine CoA-transferase CaiB-like acyl-CoA transferase
VGLYETGLHVASRDLVGVQLKTHLLGRPEREPHGEFSMPGYGAYLTADERWMYLLMLNDTHWAKFCQALQLPQAGDAALATLRQRKKARDEVEALVKAAMVARTFDDIAARLKAAGMGFTEVLPLERVLEAPQAHQPGKLRTVDFRGLDFEVPEFPRLGAAQDGLTTLPPPELGEHTLDVLRAAGLTANECEDLIEAGAVAGATPSDFAWTPMKHAA